MTREERKNVYLDLCAKQKITGLFMQPWWLDAAGSWEVALAIRNDQVVGAMPYTPGRRWGIKTIGMPLQTHHLRIWMDKPPDVSDHKWLTREKQILWLLIDDLPGYGYFSMVFEGDSFNNWLPFHWKGFRQEMRYTFVLDRTDPDTLDQQINRNMKRTLREHEEDLQCIRNIPTEGFLDICRETYRRQGIPMPLDTDTFQKLDQAISQHDAGIRLGAMDRSGQCVAVAYLLWDDRRAYYWLSGDNENGRKLGASIRLCHEAIRIAFEEKALKTFDFCGSMLEPVTEIRRQFGARAEPLMKIFRARYKWLDVVYSLTRK